MLLKKMKKKQLRPENYAKKKRKKKSKRTKMSLEN